MTTKAMNPTLHKLAISFGWLLLFALFLLFVAGSLDFESHPWSYVTLLGFGALSVWWLWIAWKRLKTWYGTAVASGAVVFLVLLYAAGVWLAWIGVQS